MVDQSVKPGMQMRSPQEKTEKATFSMRVDIENFQKDSNSYGYKKVGDSTVFVGMTHFAALQAIGIGHLPDRRKLKDNGEQYPPRLKAYVVLQDKEERDLILSSFSEGVIVTHEQATNLYMTLMRYDLGKVDLKTTIQNVNQLLTPTPTTASRPSEEHTLS